MNIPIFNDKNQKDFDDKTGRLLIYDVGCIFDAGIYGPLEVLERIGKDKLLVRFIRSGTEKVTFRSQIQKKTVKDKNYKYLFGVACIGEGEYRSRKNGKSSRAFLIWSSMISRCYNKNNKFYEIYKKCSVCEEWLNFQNFAEWYENNYVDGLHLDKDLLSGSTKVYSPETCSFITQELNSQLANAKYYEFLKDGKPVKIYNLSKFCRENELSYSRMQLVNRGLSKKYKGYTETVSKDGK